MTDLLNLVVMIFTAIAAMLFGVLTSYSVFHAAFWLMQPNRKLAIVKSRVKAAVKHGVETA
jgi:hypothetical protein